MKIAQISSFESFATLDGKGVRFAVFFQGCPLRCIYCHNPETWEKVSPSATVVTSQKLLEKTLRFQPYFVRGGGVTLSGGEPLLQADFLLEFCLLLRKENVNITLDTSGSVLNETVEKLLPLCDEIILDLKFHNEADYRKNTGFSLAKVLDFLSAVDKSNGKTTLRTVIIPGVNDTARDIEKYYEIAKNFSCVKDYQLLAFHTLGFSKYTKIGIENPLINSAPLSAERLSDLQNYLDSLFGKKKAIEN